MIKIPIFEYECNVCHNIDERLEFGREMDEEHYCSLCKGLASRIVSPCKFELVYHPQKDSCDWMGNTSHYWDEVKKQRNEGKNVKPVIDGDKY